MAYTGRNYTQDAKREWTRARPQLAKGIVSPVRVAHQVVFKNNWSSFLVELGNWMTMFLLCIPRLLIKMLFFTFRLVLKK